MCFSCCRGSVDAPSPPSNDQPALTKGYTQRLVSRLDRAFQDNPDQTYWVYNLGTYCLHKEPGIFEEVHEIGKGLLTEHLAPGVSFAEVSKLTYRRITQEDADTLFTRPVTRLIKRLIERGYRVQLTRTNMRESFEPPDSFTFKEDYRISVKHQ